MTDIFNVKFNIPDYVHEVLKSLKSNGFEGFIVGGCVRDACLDKEPSDWDITTSAKPEEIVKIFPKSVDIGASHGTIGVICGKVIVEVTTYRIDGNYSDNRHPDCVSFTRKLSDDLSRRDFTINAMAYCDDTGLIDLYGGMDDLAAGIIRCVGDADRRFNEDALRMLRAVRFAAQLGFKIELETFAAIEKNATLIQNISAERIRCELDKILLSDHAELLKTIADTRLGKYILPELCECFNTPQNTKYHIYNVGEHTIHTVKNSPKRLNIRLAALMHDFGKPEMRTTDDEGVDHFYSHQKVSEDLAGNILSRLKYSNQMKDSVLPLVAFHDMQINADKKAVKRAISKVSDELFLDLLDLKVADCLSQNPEYSLERQILAENIRKLYFEIKENSEAVSLSDLAINGRDLIDIGITEGVIIGKTLKLLLSEVIDNPELNDKEILLERAKEMC